MTDDVDQPGAFTLGGTYLFELANGRRITATVTAQAGGWLRLDRARSTLHVNISQIVCYQAPGSASLADDAPEASGRSRPAIDPQDWDEPRLRRLAEGYLDGQGDSELATICERPRSEVRRLRRSFEAARGNLDPDRLGEQDRAWSVRWQAVLGG